MSDINLRELFIDVASAVDNGGSRGFVYFMERVGGPIPAVKIGWATDPAERLKALQTGCPDELRVLRTIECADATGTEADLHRAFAEHRIRGEWFHAAPVRALLEEMQGSDRWPRWLALAIYEKRESNPIDREVMRKVMRFFDQCMHIGKNLSWSQLTATDAGKALLLAVAGQCALADRSGRMWAFVSTFLLHRPLLKQRGANGLG